MDLATIQRHWATLTPALQQDFPHVRIPDIFPHGALWESLVERIAEAHDLTHHEALEALDDRCLGLILREAAAKAA